MDHRTRQGLQQAGRHLLVGLGRIGARAAATAYQSALRDVGGVVDQVKTKIDRATQEFETFLGGEDHRK
jgi:hypothetical protein